MPRNLEAELGEWDGTWPKAWAPQKPGEILVGVIKQFSVGQGLYGPVHTCIVEKSDGTRLSVWLSSTVLLAAFQAQKPRVGEKIGIKFLGRPEGKTYKKFALLIDRDPEEQSFTALGGEVDPSVEPVRTTDGGATPYAAATIRPTDRVGRDTRQPAPDSRHPPRRPTPLAARAPAAPPRPESGPAPDPNDPFEW